MKHEIGTLCRRLSAEGVNLAKGVKPASPKLGMGCLIRNDNAGNWAGESGPIRRARLRGNR